MEGKPVQAEVDWQEPWDPGQNDETPGDIALTKPGRHVAAEWVKKNHELQVERRAKYQRDYRGNVPPPEYQINTKTRIAMSSEAYRRGYSLVDWSQ